MQSKDPKPFDTGIYLLLAILVLPALLTNLGMMTLIGDEGIRTLVALEMDRSGNYITPTLHGEFYYKKPPLFNWLVLAFFKLTGSESEFSARLTTVFFLLVYAGTIIAILRRYFSLRFAVTIALMLVTCGRMLFYDSMLALIDTCFSWVMFLNFMLVYYFFKRRAWWPLMLVSYFLTATGFMLKGLPALVFQATTLLTIFIWQREFKRLFHLPHIAGILFLAALLGSYYYAYAQYNELEFLFYTLFDESSQRTAVNYGWTATLWHLLTFPFEMHYHFLPWTLLSVAFLNRRVRSWIRENEFVHYCLLILLTNLIPYWLSVEVYPRYLLMHVPLYFIVVLYLFKKLPRSSWQVRTVEIVFGALAGLMVLAALVPAVVPLRAYVPYVGVKCGLLFVLFAGCAYLFYHRRAQRLLIFGAVLLTFRLGFDWFVLPDRLREDRGTEVRLSTLDVARRYGERPLAVFDDSYIETVSGYYLTRATGRIIPRVFENFDTTTTYIFDPTKFEPAIDPTDDLLIRTDRRTLPLGKLRSDFVPAD